MRRKKKKNPGRYFLRVLIVLFIVYAAGVYFYSSHFPHNASINGIDIGGMSLENAIAVLDNHTESYDITLMERDDKSETILASDIGLTLDLSEQAKEVFSSYNPFLWPASLFKEESVSLEATVSYDEDAFEETFKKLKCFDDVISPSDAGIKMGETCFEIVPAEEGNEVKKKKLKKLIKAAIAEAITKIDLEEEGCYKEPEILDDNEELQSALTEMNRYAATVIEYDLGYYSETLDYSITKDWILLSKTYEVSIDEDAVADYVASLKESYDTLGRSHPFTTSYGETISITDGFYGWRISTENETAQILTDLETGKNIEREPEYSYTAYSRDKNGDIGDSYVEISITDQTLWLYIDGTCIVTSDVVTGDTTKGNGTSTGIYGVTYKQSPATLTGETYSSDVTYWMPFNGNQGMHDASWRSEFGGSIYQGNGSHGCVNCPYDTAKTLYQYVEAGFPVIIY